MGATREIINSGSAFSPILKSGIWTSGGYKCYLNLHSDEAINISALLASAMDSDSDDPDALPTPTNDKNATMPWGRPESYYDNGEKWDIRPL